MLTGDSQENTIWLAARVDFLAREKEFTKARDALSVARRALPRVKLEKSYSFEGPDGTVSLEDLFEGRSQLIIYHFMYGTDWEEGCPSCSFWADNFDGIGVHLAHRDTSFVTISKGPLDKLLAYRKRMGWSFPWYSAANTDFNEDFNVSFSDEQVENLSARYNYKPGNSFTSELVGISVFYREDDGAIYHTYSTYGRGVDLLNGAYNYLDLTPKGRDEGDGFTMAWLRRHDAYDD